jgi:hypothetical protein
MEREPKGARKLALPEARYPDTSLKKIVILALNHGDPWSCAKGFPPALKKPWLKRTKKMIHEP